MKEIELIPISGVAYFVVSRTGVVSEILDFSYLDSNKEYLQLIHDEREFKKETTLIWKNMQGFLDKERIIINDQRVRSEVKLVDIIYRGLDDVPHVLFFIEFRGTLVNGLNTIETYTEEEELEYDVEAYWKFPHKTRIIEVITPMEYEINKNFILLWSRKGNIIGGYEKITFEFR